MKYQILVEVDEATLRQSTEDLESSVSTLIEQEAGWLTDSGIYAVEVTSVEPLLEDDEHDAELPIEHLMLHITSFGSQTIVKGNKTGLVALADVVSQALAYRETEAETFRVGGDPHIIHIAVAETFREISIL